MCREKTKGRHCYLLDLHQRLCLFPESRARAVEGGTRILLWQGRRLQSHPCTGVTSATRPSGPEITLNETCIGVMLTYTQLERQR